MPASKLRFAVSSVIAILTLHHLAWGQSNPSAQQLINQLAPTGAVSETTRGIRPIAPGAEMAPAPMAATPAASPLAVKPSANLVVDFASGSATLTANAVVTLDQLGKALTSQQLAAYDFSIVGHTDTTGTAAVNQSLSQARAEAVKSYLEGKFGVSDARLKASGVGESDLAVATPANTPERRNRRVEIINLGQ